MEKNNWEILIPGMSLVFNIASMINISDFISSISSEFKAVSMIQILEGMPQLLMRFSIISGPWVIAILLSLSRERKSGIRAFSIITVITCTLIVGFKHTGPSEAASYEIAIQIFVAWVVLGIFLLIKTRSHNDKL